MFESIEGLRTTLGDASMQRMPQKPVVRDAVEHLLRTSGRTDAELVVGFTHRALAARVFDTDQPTASQLSSVRRAVAVLVDAGVAERDEERAWGWARNIPWRIDLPPGADAWPHGYTMHERQRGGHVYMTENPGGVTIHRVPTKADSLARKAWMRKHPLLPPM
jgi:hypothetical protein